MNQQQGRFLGGQIDCSTERQGCDWEYDWDPDRNGMESNIEEISVLVRLVFLVWAGHIPRDGFSRAR